MKTPFETGATKIFRRLVTPADFAILNGRLIHELLGTFALGRDMEWTSRLFVEDMLEPGEAGLGARLEIEHHGPAFENETVEFTATYLGFSGRELLCRLEAEVGVRLVATGRTGQRIVPASRLPTPSRFNRLLTANAVRSRALAHLCPSLSLGLGLLSPANSTLPVEFAAASPPEPAKLLPD